MEYNSPAGLSPMQRFWRLLKPDAKEIRNIYIYAAFNGLVALTLPLGIQAIINLIQGGQISTSWIVLVAFVVFGVGLNGILRILQMRVTENIQQKIFTRAAFEFTYRIPRIRMETLFRHYAPELMNRFFDVMTVQKGLSKILIDFSTGTLHVIFGLILLSLYHPFFIAFSLVLVVLIYAIIRYTGVRGLNTSLRESKYKYMLAHWLEEMARAATSFKLAGATNLHMQRTDEFSGSYLEARESHFQILIRQFSLMVVFKVIVAAGLLLIGGILVIEQQMNIGQFVAAEIIILLVMGAVEKLILSMESIYDVLTGLEKIGQVTDLELEKTSGAEIKGDRSIGMEVCLEHVSFSYPGSLIQKLCDISFTIPQGQKVMVAGNSSSGKSTLLAVISGLFQVQEGAVSYDGLPKGNLSSESLYSVIGDCLSHEQIFQGTIMENIAIGRPNASLEWVEKVVKSLGLSEFIRRAEEGYNTILEPEGKGLPKQIVTKILLARSVADKPRLLLLDAAFEHLDQPDRESIIRFLTADENPWTLIATGSEPILARYCDRVMILHKGKFIKEGKGEEALDTIKPNNSEDA